MSIIKENIPLLELANINIWNNNTPPYDGSLIHIVIFDKKGSPLKFIENAYAPFCPTFIHSHATNVCSVIRQFSACKITMLYSSDECREYFKQIADTVDIVNISMSADKSLAEYSWGFLEQYDLPVFCSSGNDGDDELNFPSAFSWAISVGAYSKGRVVDYSNWSNDNSDDKLDCVGITNVYVENSDKKSFLFNGTSCSSPQIASTVTHYAHFIKENYNRKLGRKETFEFIHNNCLDIKGDKDGFGLFKLPSIPTVQKPIQPKQPEIIINPPSSPLPPSSPTPEPIKDNIIQEGEKKMVNKPQITWIGSPHYSSPKGYKFIAIVNHIMQGTLSGTDSWFKNPSSKVSSHFGVGKNGEIHQYVDLKNPAWANGGVNKPNWKLYSGVNPNYYTVSIEHEGYSGDIMSEKQYAATLALHKWLVDYLDIEVNSDTIIGHYRIDSVNKANCPGSGFPWDRLFRDLKNNNGDDFEMDVCVVYFTPADYSSALILSNLNGGCAMFCRNASPNVHPDVKKAKKVITVGGGKLNLNNEIYLSGNEAKDTLIAVANYLQVK